MYKRMEVMVLLVVVVSVCVLVTLNDVCESKAVTVTVTSTDAGGLHRTGPGAEGEAEEEEYIEYYDYEDDRDTDCQDDLPKENCTDVISRGRCGDRQDMRAMLCMKSCGYCQPVGSGEEAEKVTDKRISSVEEEEEWLNVTEEGSSPSTILWVSESAEEAEVEVEEADDMRKDCEDKLPTCSAHYSQEFCCQMKQAMNYSCEKTCKFCSQTPATIIPGGNGPFPPAQVPTATSNQDPCRNNEGQPPSVTVDGPGNQGATPGNQGGFPGITLTTTTTTTTTTSNPLATVLPTAPPGHPITVPPSSGR